MRKTLPFVLAAALGAAAHAQTPGRPSLTVPPVAAPVRTEPPPSKPVPARKPVVRGSVLEEVSGSVRAVDRKDHRLTIETPAGTVTLSLDRNTMVYTASGLGTILDLAPDQQIRAGRNADFLAYWVQVRGPAGAPPASPGGQGTGPADGGAAPAGESGGPPSASAPATAPGTVPPAATPPGK
jgi:hypothetical protein